MRKRPLGTALLEERDRSQVKTSKSIKIGNTTLRRHYILHCQFTFELTGQVNKVYVNFEVIDIAKFHYLQRGNTNQGPSINYVTRIS